MSVQFVPEDGTGLPNATSLADLDGFKQYLDNGRRGSVPVDVQDDDLRQRLNEATRYLETTYGRQWQGARSHIAQSLSWPRTGVLYGDRAIPEGAATGYPGDALAVPGNVIPDELKAACYVLAIATYTAPLWIAAGATAQGALIEKRTGPITKKWANPVAPGAQPRFDQALALINAFLRLDAGVTLRSVRV